MALIRRRGHAPRREPRSGDFEVVAQDTWVSVADEAPLPVGGDVLVSLARFETDTASCESHTGRLGVRVPNDTAPERLEGPAKRVALIALDFPTGRDGRAFSLAHWLRARFAFDGELRATGKVARDQLSYLARVGFDAFELTRGSATDALASFDELSVHYQAADDQKLPLWKRTARP